MAGDGDTELLNLVFKLFSPDHSKHFNKWLQINDPFSDHLTGMGTNYKNNCPSPLLYATKLGFRDCALRLLKAGADVNACHSVHGTPLSKACELGNQNLAKLLLQYGASIDKLGAATNVPYGTPLEVAVAKGKSCIVHLLLSKGANPNAQGRYGNVLHTALSSTCSPGITTDIALCLIRAGAIKFSIFSTEPSSMTCMASLRGLESVVEELLRNVTLLRFEGPAQRADITGPRGLKRIHSQLSQHLDWRWELKLSDSTVLTWQKGITIFRFLRNPTSFSNSLRPRNRLRERMMRQPLSPAAAHVFTDTNIETGRGRQSSKNRHESVFLVILNSGINPKYWGQYPSHILTPLAIYTYRYRRVQIVQWQTSHTWNGNISSPPASKLDDLDRANLLIRASQDLEAQTISSDSALHLALAKGYVPSFQKSLDPGPNFREMDEQSGSPLQRASSADNEAMVKLLLSSGLSANIAVGNSFGTALQEASYHNHELMVELLLNAGADVNQPGFGPRQTALQEAVKQGNLQIMEILLHSGATAGTALPEASKRGSIDIVRRLLAADADPNAHLPGGKTALQEACAHGHFDLASLLIGMGANVNTPGVRDVGGTALQEASSEGYLRIVQLLLTSGADVNAAGISGWCGTALQEAAHASQVQLTKLLIQSGADVNAPAGYWGSAVEAAAAAGCNDVIEILIESGAAVGDALRVATREENIETVRLLLQRCWADITHQDGMTVLHEAVENSDIAMAEILLDYGANINTAATANCPTPLQLAYDIGDNRMIEFLIDRGADVNVASCHHCVTPQQLTLSRGYTGVLEVLLKIGVYIWSMRITHEKEIDEAV
jgi:ankyrin repeat protein